jgi:hypothetical protein
MATVISPTNYGLVPYGIASYASYFSSQSPVIVVTPPLIMEALVTTLIPADVKVYFSIQE